MKFNRGRFQLRVFKMIFFKEQKIKINNCLIYKLLFILYEKTDLFH